jgi:internalin A
MERGILQSRKAIEIRSLIKNVSLPHLLIEDNKQKKEPFLDLGNCGLTNSSLDMFADCNHLKSLSLGTAYYDESGKYIESNNKQTPNIFNYIPNTLPAQLAALQVRGASIQNMSNIDRLTDLNLLDLSNNKISKIENIDNLTSLHELALHGNEITGIKEVQFPENLKILHLSYNKIASLEGIENCPKLEDLVIYNNQISSIYPITKLPALKTLNVQSNPITDCPSDVWVDNDIQQIKAYFNEMRLSKAWIYR